MSGFFGSEFGLHLREMARHWRLLLLVGLAAGVLAFALTSRRPQAFVSEATLRVSVIGIPADDGSVTEFRTRSLAEYASSADVVRATIARSTSTVAIDDDRSQFIVTLRDTPGYLDLSARASTPEASSSVVNAWAEALIDETTSSSAAGGDQISAELIESATPGTATRVVTGRRSASAGLVAAVVSVIVIAEAIVALRLVQGRFSPINPALEIGQLVGASAIDARSWAAGQVAVPFFVEHLRDRPVLAVVQTAKPASTGVACGLAKLAGAIHQRVLLVDGDIGRPTLHVALGQQPSPGVSDIVQGRSSLRAAVRPAMGELRAAILTAGRPLPSSPGAVEQLQGLRHTLARAGADQVLISVTQSSGLDGMLLVAHAFPEAVVLVVDPAEYRVRQLRRLVEQLRDVGAQIVAVVLWSSTAHSSIASINDLGQAEGAHQ